jgi:hypothetical protein
MTRGGVLLAAFALVAGIAILKSGAEAPETWTFTGAAGASMEAVGDGRIVHVAPVVVVVVVLLALLFAVGTAFHIKMHWRPGGSIKDLFR